MKAQEKITLLCYLKWCYGVKTIWKERYEPAPPGFMLNEN